MIYLKIYKAKNFYFLIPLNQILSDEASYKKIENLPLSNKPITVDKLSNRNEETELLAIIYEQLAQSNLFGLFTNILALQFEKL